MAILLLAGIPAATANKLPDLSERPDERCPEGWGGSQTTGEDRACIFVEQEPRSWSDTRDYLFYTEARYHTCPDGFGGIILEHGSKELGACYRVFYQAPEEPWVVLVADLSSCEAPDDREGEDPVIYVADGFVGFCVVPIVDPGEELETNVSTEPCRPDMTDPEVQTFLLDAQVCVDVSVQGYGNPQLQYAVELYHDALAKLPPYAPRP